MDYLKFYDLKLEPFKNDFSSEFYFESEGQRRARLRLMRGIEQKKGLSVLVGGPGCGKTTLAERLLSNLDQTQWAAQMIVVPHSSCASGWLLPQLATRFGVDSLPTEIPELLAQIGLRFVQIRESGQHPVLFVDEAQMLQNAQAMEEFRSLLNLVHEGEKLISIVLLGLPELSGVIGRDPPLAQRIDIRVELCPMELEEASAYLQHRLGRAGGAGTILSPEAITALYRYSRGVPRVLNTLADNSLFEGFLAEETRLDASIVSGAADDLGLTSPPARPASVPEEEADTPAAQAAAAPEVKVSTFSAPPLPAPSALEVAAAEEEFEEGDKAPEEEPSAWESGLWEEPHEDDSADDGDDDLPADPLFAGDVAFPESSGELQEVEPLEPDEDDGVDLGGLPQDDSPAELPEPLELEPVEAVLEAVDEVELEISPIDDDLEELEVSPPTAPEVPPAVAPPAVAEADSAALGDSGFDLGSLLADEAEDEPAADVSGAPAAAAETADVASSDSDDDDFESLFDAIQLSDG